MFIQTNKHTDTQKTRKPLILIVDDSDTNRELLATMSEHLGYTPLTLENPIDLQTITRRVYSEGEEISVVISDLQMPGCSGDEVLDFMRKTYPATARILMSGRRDLLDERSESGRADEYLAKPFRLETLKNTLENMTQIYKQRKEN